MLLRLFLDPRRIAISVEKDQVHAEFARHLMAVAWKMVIVDYEPLSF